jgi:cholesterol transport system auxiliary component
VIGARRLAVAAVLALALSACAGSAPPPDSYHRLTVPAPAPRATPLLHGALEVDRLSAVDALRSRPLAVVDAASGVLRHARYDLWVEGPPELLRDALVGYLRAAGLAERVVTPELRDQPRWIVSGRIQRFERVVGAGGSVAVSLELFLRDGGGGPPRVDRVYEVTRPAPGDSTAAAIEALGTATGEAFAAFTADVEAAFAAPSPASP